jgi:hypothetical protein
MFVIIGISSAGKRWPLGSPTMSLDEAKRIAEKSLEDDKNKGRGTFIKWKLSIKLGQLFSSFGTINNKQIVLTLGHWVIQDVCPGRSTLEIPLLHARQLIRGCRTSGGVTALRTTRTAHALGPRVRRQTEA